jgi:hypothetical protein
MQYVKKKQNSRKYVSLAGDADYRDSILEMTSAALGKTPVSSFE